MRGSGIAIGVSIAPAVAIAIAFCRCQPPPRSPSVRHQFITPHSTLYAWVAISEAEVGWACAALRHAAWRDEEEEEEGGEDDDRVIRGEDGNGNANPHIVVVIAIAY